MTVAARKVRSSHLNDSDLSSIAARWAGSNAGLPPHLASCTPCLDRFLQMLNPSSSVRRSKPAGSRDWFIWNCGPNKIFKSGGNVFLATPAISAPPAVRGIRRLDGKARRGNHIEFEWMDFRFSLSWNRARSRLNISCLDGPFSNPEIIFDLVQGVSKNRDTGKQYFFASDHLPLGGRLGQSLDVPPQTSRLRLRLKHPTGATVEGQICLR